MRPRFSPHIATLLAALLASVAARADDPVPGGAVPAPPVLASAAAPVRQALIVAPGAADPAPSAGPLRRDAVAYGHVLRLLGFEVTTLAPATRPELDAGLRGFAGGVRAGADVAILVLGDVRPTAGGLALVPPGSSPDRAEGEGLRFTDALHRAVERGPHPMAVVIDGCADAAQACAAGLATLPPGVGAIVARRRADAAATLGPALLPAMVVEGRALPQLRDVLAAAVAGGDLDVVASPTLPPGFAFLPLGFLAGLPLACNDVDVDLPAEALRGRPSLEPLVAACREAAARYGFSPFFKVKLASAEEQEAARRGLASCADATIYLATFPEGRYRTAVETKRQTCEARTPPPEPPPASPLTAVQERAVEMVTTYFRQHDYGQGFSFTALARLYGPAVKVRGVTLPTAERMRRVGAWYGDYDSVRFGALPGSLDVSGCASVDDCRVLGRYHVSALPAGGDAFLERDEPFSLRLDLASGQVLAECGVAEPAAANGGCD